MKKSWSTWAFAAPCCVLVVALLALPVVSLATSADDEYETAAETDEAADDENSGGDADTAEESDASTDDESADTSEETEASADDAVAADDAVTSGDESDSDATDDVDGATDEDSDYEDDDTAYGVVFEDVRTGLRAQVQHLKAYASTDDLVNECVDPRFDLVTKGIAPTLEELNGRWAIPGDGYGELIAATIDDLLEFVLC